MYLQLDAQVGVQPQLKTEDFVGKKVNSQTPSPLVFVEQNMVLPFKRPSHALAVLRTVPHFSICASAEKDDAQTDCFRLKTNSKSTSRLLKFWASISVFTQQCDLQKIPAPAHQMTRQDTLRQAVWSHEFSRVLRRHARPLRDAPLQSTIRPWGKRRDALPLSHMTTS